MNKLLSLDQAKSAYGAMCELNNVSATLNASLRNGLSITSSPTGQVAIYAPGVKERYRSQAMFAAAYGLN